MIPKDGRRSRTSATRRKTGGKGALAVSRSTTLVNTLKKGERPEESMADMVVSGLLSNAFTAVQFSKSPIGDVDLTVCLAKLNAAVERVQRVDLRETEALLTAQAVTLNTMFTHLANLAASTEYLDKLDRYLRLALKAQGQCRATLETLATIKNPPVVFARQANIAQGPQQVNNTVSLERRDDRLTRAAKRTTRSNRTIDVDRS